MKKEVVTFEYKNCFECPYCEYAGDNFGNFCGKEAIISKDAVQILRIRLIADIHGTIPKFCTLKDA